MNILIAHKSRLTGEGINLIISSQFNQAEIIVIDNANDLLKRVSASSNHPWRVILIDSELVQLVTPKQLLKYSPTAKVCLISNQTSPQINAKCLRDGFNGLLPISSSASEVGYIMNILLSGQNYFPAAINMPAESFMGSNSKNNLITYRQQEVLSLVALGFSNKEIANHYNLTESTVKRHLSNIYKKLGVNNRIAAIRCGTESQLLLK